MIVHSIDPIIASIFGIHLWWYGLSYALGFFNAHLFLRRNRDRLGLSLRAVYDLSLCIVIGGAVGVLVFCLVHRQPFRPIFDALAIPAALILGFGRIGNFIDGQIVGSVTSVPWAVRFPEADGFRHPVVLYDGLKNFALIPLLLWVRRGGAPPGRLAALFVFLYPLLRIPIDLLREYPITLFGLPTGQTFNILMTILGAALLLRNWFRQAEPRIVSTLGPAETFFATGLWWRRLAFAACLLVVLVIPSDATRDVPMVYAKRHPGLTHSSMYPPLD